MLKNKVVMLKIDESTRHKLKVLAVINQKSMSDFLIELIENEMREYTRQFGNIILKG